MNREDEAIKNIREHCYFANLIPQAKEALDVGIEALRDIKEIEEVINCDANAETKCKMISNILTAKPHYFEKQEPLEVEVTELQNYNKGFEDCRQSVLDGLASIAKAKAKSAAQKSLMGRVMFFVEQMSSVQPKIGHRIVYDVHGHKACKCSECGMDVGYPCNDAYCKYCGAKIESEDI